MALLTLEGFEVPVLPGTEVRDEPWGDFARAYSGRMRSDRRASHRSIRVVASLFDTADDAVALRAILNTPGPVLAGGTMIGDDAYFHVRNIQFAPQTVDRLSFSFELVETDDSPSPLLFSFDGDAPGTYTFTRSGNVGPFTNASGLLRGAAPNILRREYLWLDGTYAAATRPDTASYLIEAARTNLVTTDDITAWTDVNTPVVTANISDPAGGTGAYRVADDNGASVEAKTRVVAFTGNAVKTIVAVVREATMPASGHHIIVYDATAAAYRLILEITAWTSGAPTATAGTGTYLGKRYVGNGYWALYAQTTSVTAANTNRVEIYPAATSTHTGSLDVYRVNAYDSTVPGWSILNASEARSADWLYAPYTPVPQAMTVYVKMIEAGTSAMANALRVLEIGNTTIGDNRFLTISGAAGTGYYSASYYNGITTASSTLATLPAWGDTVELMVTLTAAGVVQMSQSLNAGTATTATAGSAVALPFAWSQLTATIGAAGDGSANGLNPILSVKVARGVQSFAYMRDVAKGRLHPRADNEWAFRARYTLSASVAATSATTATESP